MWSKRDYHWIDVLVFLLLSFFLLPPFFLLVWAQKEGGEKGGKEKGRRRIEGHDRRPPDRPPFFNRVHQFQAIPVSAGTQKEEYLEKRKKKKKRKERKEKRKRKTRNREPPTAISKASRHQTDGRAHLHPRPKGGEKRGREKNGEESKQIGLLLHYHKSSSQSSTAAGYLREGEKKEKKRGRKKGRGFVSSYPPCLILQISNAPPVHTR